MSTYSMDGWDSLFGQFLQSLPDPAMIADLQGRVAFVNDKMLELVGLSREQAIGQPFPYPWLLPQAEVSKLPWVSGGEDFEGLSGVESQITDSHGVLRTISFSITPLRDPEGRSQLLLNLGRDVAPQPNSGGLLQGAEPWWARMVEDLPAWVQIEGLDRGIEMVNRTACAISGYDRAEMVGQSWPYPWFPEGWSKDGADPLLELRQQGDVVEFEAACVTPEGESKDLSLTLTLVAGDDRQPCRVLMLAYDITERKLWCQRLLQSETIRTLSQLASGVAHDINNDLAVILGYSEYLLGKLQDLDEADQHALDAIQLQAQSCSNTVRRMQLFSRRTPRSKFTYFSINDVVREVVEDMENVWGGGSSDAWTGVHLEADLQWVHQVHAHRSGLKEVVTSLVENAADVVSGGGKVSIRTTANDDEVILEVADDGPGIEPDVVKRIFEPFFTTKGPASSGLGLSIAYNLVGQMDGGLSVESQLGKGTTITVRLPAVIDDEDSSKSPAMAANKLSSLDVMVVDDEPLVAGMLRTFLESAGHRVAVFLEGAEAVESFRSSAFDLVVVDLGMPEMDGWEVSRRINEIRPEVPIIISTGWNMTIDDATEHGVVVDTVLRKPFTMVELMDALSSAAANRTK